MNPNMMNRNVSYYGVNRNSNKCSMPMQEETRNTNCCRMNRENMPTQETTRNTNCGRMNRENMTCNNYEVDRQQLERMNQHQLLSYLNQVSFSMYDTTLFLDTHPCNREALAYFNQMKHARMHALEIYEKKFGPLLLDNVDADCEWTWGMQPLPWEPMC